MPTFRERFQRARLDELGVLVEVAESGSLSAAAKKLRVPKSTVGRAIRRIEEDLGVSLVRRMTTGPALTEPGRLLVDMAAPHIAALRDASAALGRDSERSVRRIAHHDGRGHRKPGARAAAAGVSRAPSKSASGAGPHVALRRSGARRLRRGHPSHAEGVPPVVGAHREEARARSTSASTRARNTRRAGSCRSSRAISWSTTTWSSFPATRTNTT